MGLQGQWVGSSVLCVGSCIQGECLQQKCLGWPLVWGGLFPHGRSDSGVWPELLQSQSAEVQDRHGSIKTWLENLRMLLLFHAVG